MKIQMMVLENSISIKRQGQGNFKTVVLTLANVGITRRKARKLAEVLDLVKVDEDKWETNNG